MNPPEVALSRGDRVRRRVDGLEGVVVAVMPRHVTVEFRHQHGSRSFRLSFLPRELEPAPPLQGSLEVSA